MFYIKLAIIGCALTLVPRLRAIVVVEGETQGTRCL